MTFLRKLNIQAQKNSEDLKLQVNTRIDELTAKVDNAKAEASQKEERDKIKMDSIKDRLDKIEDSLASNKNKCEEREKLAKEQFERVDNFREVHGLERVASEDTDINTGRRKEPTWSELVLKNKEKKPRRRSKILIRRKKSIGTKLSK